MSVPGLLPGSGSCYTSGPHHYCAATCAFAAGALFLLGLTGTASTPLSLACFMAQCVRAACTDLHPLSHTGHVEVCTGWNSFPLLRSLDNVLLSFTILGLCSWIMWTFSPLMVSKGFSQTTHLWTNSLLSLCLSTCSRFSAGQCVVNTALVTCDHLCLDFITPRTSSGLSTESGAEMFLSHLMTLSLSPALVFGGIQRPHTGPLVMAFLHSSRSACARALHPRPSSVLLVPPWPKITPTASCLSSRSLASVPHHLRRTCCM